MERLIENRPIIKICLHGVEYGKLKFITLVES